MASGFLFCVATMEDKSEEVLSDSTTVSTSEVYSSLSENDDTATYYTSSVMILLVIQ